LDGGKFKVYASKAKKNNENFDDVIDVDECTVAMREFSAKNWQKPQIINF
jgi:hypothetical protein